MWSYYPMVDPRKVYFFGKTVGRATDLLRENGLPTLPVEQDELKVMAIASRRAVHYLHFFE